MTPSGCARIPTSFSSTTTCRRGRSGSIGVTARTQVRAVLHSGDAEKPQNLSMNRRFGARRLRRFSTRCGNRCDPGRGVNAALRFRGSRRELLREILTPALWAGVRGNPAFRQRVYPFLSGRSADARSSQFALKPLVRAPIQCFLRRFPAKHSCGTRRSPFRRSDIARNSTRSERVAGGVHERGSLAG
jgi:hypothetical protein